MEAQIDSNYMRKTKWDELLLETIYVDLCCIFSVRQNRFSASTTAAAVFLFVIQEAATYRILQSHGSSQKTYSQ